MEMRRQQKIQTMRAMGNTGGNRSNNSSDVTNESRNMRMEPTMPLLLLAFHKQVVNQILENDHHSSLSVMAKGLSLENVLLYLL